MIDCLAGKNNQKKYKITCKNMILEEVRRNALYRKMKEIFVEKLDEHINQIITEVFYCTGFKRNQNKEGRAWVDVQLIDKTGQVRTKIWSEFDNARQEECENHYCVVTGFVDVFNGMVGMAIKEIKPAEDGTYDVSDFAPSITNEEKERYLEELDGYINQISDNRLKNLLNKVFNPSVRNMFCTLPAGVVMHHNYNGALLVHTLEVTSLAAAAAKISNEHASGYKIPVDMDLVIAGALLHDLGKINEYEPFPKTHRTKRGNMIGHIMDGAILLHTYNLFLPPNERCDTTDLLHIILSSHGEAGGVSPMTQEAIIVHNADEQSAGVDAYSAAFRNEEKFHPGMSVNTTFSKYHDCKLYRKKEE